MRILVLAVPLFLAPSLAQAQSPESPEADPSAEATEDLTATEWGADTESVDPLTQHIQNLVLRYYEAIGQEPEEQQIQKGIQSVQLLLLDGVTLPRIADGVERAIALHRPGRSVPFEVAVPLRITHSTTEEPLSSAQDGLAETAPSLAPDVDVLDPELAAKRADRQARREARNIRLQLHRQWQERTLQKRVLFSIGIPLLASGYAMGWAGGGILTLMGEVPHYSAWVTAVPLVGPLILGIWLEGEQPGFFVLSGLQIAGTALIIAAAAQKVDWPYDKDPAALRIGRRRDGRTALTLRLRPAGAGGVITGSF